ncbi:MAG: carboxypeptidase-like regulatory domain-containing protein [Bacteroidetes bacterium]|nr:carboxypeptidase-like regulatory domain-containing protein [Bacteroidota bacterium]
MNTGNDLWVLFIRGAKAACFLLPLVLLIPIQVCSQSSPSTPAFLQGIVSNGASGAPVVGAKVVVNGQSTRSAALGVYTLAIDPAGTFPVSSMKAGFDNYTSPPVVFQPGVTTLLNIQLWENLSPPTSVSVFLDTIPHLVPVSWSAPVGTYE